MQHKIYTIFVSYDMITDIVISFIANCNKIREENEIRFSTDQSLINNNKIVSLNMVIFKND